MRIGQIKTIASHLQLVALNIDRWRGLAEKVDREQLTSLPLLSLLVVLEPSGIILVDLQVCAICAASDALAPRIILIEKILLCHAG